MFSFQFQLILYNILLLKAVTCQFSETTFYKTCGSRSGVLCFGMKTFDPLGDDCLINKNCNLAVSIFEDPRHDGKVRFQLMGMPPMDTSGNFKGGYIAVGLSQDDQMGQDSVVECVTSDQKSRIYTSWNFGRNSNKRQEDMSYIKNQWVSFKNKTIFCDFTRDVKSKVEGNTINLKSNNGYYILLAMGNLKISKFDEILNHGWGNGVASPTPILNSKTIVLHNPPRYSKSENLKFSTIFIFVGFILGVIV